MERTSNLISVPNGAHLRSKHVGYVVGKAAAVLLVLHAAVSRNVNWHYRPTYVWGSSVCAEVNRL